MMKGISLAILKAVRKVENAVFKTAGKHLSGRGLGRIPGVAGYGRARQKAYDAAFERASPAGLAEVDVHGNRMLVDPAAGGIGAMLLVDGQMEEYDTRIFIERVKQGMTVVDAGANIGYFTLIAAKAVGDGGKVIAFEPMPRSRELLEKNIMINECNNVEVVGKALSDRQGSSEFFFDEKELLTASLNRENALEHDKDGVAEEKTITVETVALDDYLESVGEEGRIGLLKIDVEGAEGLVIAGAEKTLKKTDAIIMEFKPENLRNMGTDPWKLLEGLAGYGFIISFINERKEKLQPLSDIMDRIGEKELGEGFNLLLERGAPK